MNSIHSPIPVRKVRWKGCNIMNRNKLSITLALAIFAVALFGSSALAGPRAHAKNSWGLRGGFSNSPDQVVMGGMVELGRPWGKASVVPSFDIGLGGNATVWAANVDFRWYLIPMPETGIDFYGAVGPTLVNIDVDNFGSTTELGMSLNAGARIPAGKNRYNVEARFGVGDIPDFRLMVGYLFR